MVATADEAETQVLRSALAWSAQTVMVASVETAVTVAPVEWARWERALTRRAASAAMVAYPACREREVSRAPEEPGVRPGRPVCQATEATEATVGSVTPAHRE